MTGSPLDALRAVLPEGHGEPELLVHGRELLAVRLRGLQITCDLLDRELRCVRWTRDLEREELLVVGLDAPDAPAKLQELFDRRFPRQEPPMEV